MIINHSYFVGKLYISQVGDDASNMANNKSVLQRFIDEYEPDFLIKRLGRRLYEEFQGNLDVNGKAKPSADVQWGELLNGKEYQKDGKDYYWKGLVYKNGRLNKSMIANYIYAHYQNATITSQTAIGTVKGVAKNTIIASPNHHVVKAWREMIELCGDYVGNYHSVSYRNGIRFDDYYGDQRSSGEVTFYQYMNDHRDIYTDWEFTAIRNINQFGLNDYC